MSSSQVPERPHGWPYTTQVGVNVPALCHSILPDISAQPFIVTADCRLGKKRRRSAKSVEEPEPAPVASSNSGNNTPQKQPAPASPPAAAPAKRKRAQSLKVQLPSTPKDEKVLVELMTARDACLGDLTSQHTVKVLTLCLAVFNRSRAVLCSVQWSKKRPRPTLAQQAQPVLCQVLQAWSQNADLYV